MTLVTLLGATAAAPALLARRQRWDDTHAYNEHAWWERYPYYYEGRHIDDWLVTTTFYALRTAFRW